MQALPHRLLDSSRSRGLIGLRSLLLLIAAGAALRFLFLARKPFWFDECFQRRSRSHRLEKFPASAVVARSQHVAVLPAAADLACISLCAKRVLHPQPVGAGSRWPRCRPSIGWRGSSTIDGSALIAAALLAFNAYHVRYAQEARSYSLLRAAGNAFFGLF